MPVHRHAIDVEANTEQVVPAAELRGDYTWFILGLAYCMIKIDRSLIEAYRSALGKSVPVLTHRADRPLTSMEGSQAYDSNPWSGTIQGIPREHARDFIDYAASFEFLRKDTGHSWICNFQEVNLADPFGGVRLVPTWVALPCNTTLKRVAVVSAGNIGIANKINVHMHQVTGHG